MKKAGILITLISILLVIFGTCELVPPEAPPHNNEDDPAYYPPDAVAIESLTLEIASITILLNDTEQLTAVITPEDAVSDYLVWSSDNEGVATVTQEGLVTAVGPGTADITVETKDEKLSDTCEVTVAIPTYTVTYSNHGATGGTVPDSQTQDENSTVTVRENSGSLINVPAAGTAEAFKFGGWNTEENGTGTTYEAGTGQFTLTGDITLYPKWVNFELRDTGPAGGWIFYDKGSFSGGWRYLEAAPEDQDVSGDYTLSWGVFGNDENGDNNSVAPELQGIGDGTINSNWIYTTYSADILNYQAFAACYTYTVSGYNDWFLPSKDELNMMYINLQKGTDQNETIYTPLGGFTSDYYWSSSEGSSVGAWRQHFGIGDQDSNYKDGYYRVRAVRAF